MDAPREGKPAIDMCWEDTPAGRRMGRAAAAGAQEERPRTGMARRPKGARDGGQAGRGRATCGEGKLAAGARGESVPAAA